MSDHNALSNLKDVEVRGGIGELFKCRDREVLVPGARGTGKTFGIWLYIISRALMYPGCRILVSRQTRVALGHTTLVEGEHVMHHLGLSYLTEGANRQQRQSYNFKEGSEIVLLPMENAERLRSAQFDFAYVNEITECKQDDWEQMLGSMRNYVADYQQAIGDCNPDSPFHWVYKRATRRKRMTLLNTLHVDNPMYYEKDGTPTRQGWDYIKGTLEGLTGVRRERHLYGRWVAAEGAVYAEDWRAERHVIQPDEVPECSSYIGGMDFGFNDPFVMQIWGVKDQTLYLVKEVYRTQTGIDWWVHQAQCAMEEYGVADFICDPSGKSHIETMILRGIPARGADRSSIRRSDYTMPSPMQGSIKAGIEAVRSLLHADRIKVVQDCVGAYDDEGEWVQGRCPIMSRRDEPTCLEEEMTLYSYRKRKDDEEQLSDQPEDRYNHSCDVARYIAQHAIKNVLPSSEFMTDEIDMTPLDPLDNISGDEELTGYVL
jgi:PBSX family phage terminase large subunit